MRGPEDPNRGLAEDVMEREPGPVDRDRAEQRAERERGAVALRRRLVERAGDQLGAAKRVSREMGSARGV